MPRQGTAAVTDQCWCARPPVSGSISTEVIYDRALSALSSYPTDAMMTDNPYFISLSLSLSQI